LDLGLGLNETFRVLFGGYFASMGIFAFGCAAGNCYAGRCSTEVIHQNKTGSSG